MWTNKILTILLAVTLSILVFRALLNRQQKSVLHQIMQQIAKILLFMASLSALWAGYKWWYG